MMHGNEASLSAGSTVELFVFKINVFVHIVYILTILLQVQYADVLY